MEGVDSADAFISKDCWVCPAIEAHVGRCMSFGADPLRMQPFGDADESAELEVTHPALRGLANDSAVKAQHRPGRQPLASARLSDQDHALGGLFYYDASLGPPKPGEIDSDLGRVPLCILSVPGDGVLPFFVFSVLHNRAYHTA